jgi:alpha-glucoside transport system permease protein
VTTGTATHRGRSSARDWLLPLGGVVGLGLLVVGVSLLADRNGATRLLASIYDTIGDPAGALALRNGAGDRGLAKILMAAVAIVVGVGGVWLLYAGANALIERLGTRWAQRLTPWVFVSPALLLVGIFLVYPAVSTLGTSLNEDGGAISNYRFALTDRTMVSAFRNNVIWLVVATGGSVLLGLMIAGLFDRVRREALAKTFVFLPLAISLVGASVIWGFIYAWRPAGQAQYGLANAAWTSFGNAPLPWVQTQPINTFALILIMVWLQTGFAMVVLSAAIKGVSTEIMEAARLDGASERQLFMQVIVPMIKGSLITVATTIAIAVLKIFDIVYVMTGGRFDTDVVANRMFLEMFQFGNYGRASALAVVLFIAVVPLMLVNLRNLRRQGLGS